MTEQAAYVHLLHEGERVLWEGRPEPGSLLEPGLLRMSALLLLGHLGMVAMVAAGGKLTWPMALGILACYLLIDGFAVLMSILDRRSHLQNDFYRVTNRRVMILAQKEDDFVLRDAVVISDITALRMEAVSEGTPTLMLMSDRRRAALALLNLTEAEMVAGLISGQENFRGKV